MRLTTLVFAAFAFLLANANAVQAQDWTLEPHFGSESLTAGFSEDPYTVDIVAGGGKEVTFSGCDYAFTISEAPDFDFYYESGSWPLSFAAVSEGDTVLLISAPDGSWYCDDDSYGNLNPVIHFSRPESGLYNIWIGTFHDHLEGELLISEIMQ